MSLYAKENVENIFTRPNFVSFHAGWSLTKHLVKAKVYPILRECGSCCNKRSCQTCLNVKNREVFKVFLQRRVQIIYLFSCKTCGLEYVGITIERFRFRWNNYKNYQTEAAQGGTEFFSPSFTIRRTSWFSEWL